MAGCYDKAVIVASVSFVSQFRSCEVVAANKQTVGGRMLSDTGKLPASFAFGRKKRMFRRFQLITIVRSYFKKIVLVFQFRHMFYPFSLFSYSECSTRPS